MHGILSHRRSVRCVGVVDVQLVFEMFCKGIEKICIDDEENNFLESVGDYITDICYLACKHKVKLEAAFINAALACEIYQPPSRRTRAPQPYQVRRSRPHRQRQTQP